MAVHSTRRSPESIRILTRGRPAFPAMASNPATFPLRDSAGRTWAQRKAMETVS